MTGHMHARISLAGSGARSNNLPEGPAPRRKRGHRLEAELDFRPTLSARYPIPVNQAKPNILRRSDSALRAGIGKEVNHEPSVRALAPRLLRIPDDGHARSKRRTFRCVAAGVAG